MIYIYSITQLSTGRQYIGSTKDIEARKRKHFYSLSKGNHHNAFLQRAYDKTGKQDFVLDILDTTEEVDQQFLLEEEWAKELGAEFNIGSYGGGDNLTNNPRREEIIKRIGESVRKHIASLSEEERKARWSRPGELNYNWKGGVSTRSKTCIDCGSLLALNNTNGEYCNSCRDRTGENNPFYGKKHTEEALSKMSQASKQYQESIREGKTPIPTHFKAVRVDGVEYVSMSAAARALGCSTATIGNRVRSPKFPTYEFV